MRTRVIRIVLAFLITITASNFMGLNVQAASFPSNPLEKEGYTLTWNDEFDQGTVLDPTKWIPYYMPHWSNLTDSAARYSIENGVLKLKIDADQGPWCPEFDGDLVVSGIMTGNYGGTVGQKDGLHNFNGNAIVRTDVLDSKLMTQKYGYFEIRSDITNAPNYHSAWWPVGYEEDPTHDAEIDIIEAFGIGGMYSEVYWFNLHKWNDPNLTSYGYTIPHSDFPNDIYDGFHIYGLEWTETQIKLYVDNQLIRTINASPDYEMVHIFSIYGHPPFTPGESFDIDYFRVYEKNVVAPRENNLALDASVNATSEDSIYVASNINDSDVATAFMSGDNPTLPEYLTFTWDEAKTVNEVLLKTWWSLGQAPTNWDIEVSQDGSTDWTQIASSGDVTWQYNSAEIESKSIVFPSQSDIKGLRIKINNANLSWNHYAILEAEIYGDAPHAPVNVASEATISITNQNTSIPASRLIDGNTATDYVSLDGLSFPQYITFNWSEGKNVDEVTLITWWSLGQAPTNWDIEVSQDGSTDWTQIASSGDVTWQYNNATVENHTLAFAEAVGVKGLRIKINQANLMWDHYALLEIEIMDN